MTTRRAWRAYVVSGVLLSLCCGGVILVHGPWQAVLMGLATLVGMACLLSFTALMASFDRLPAFSALPAGATRAPVRSPRTRASAARAHQPRRAPRTAVPGPA